MDWNNDSFKIKYKIIARARQIFQWWPVRKDAKKKAEIMPYIHFCAGCGSAICSRPSGYTENEKEMFDKQDILLYNDKVHVDHIKPVGRFYDWNTLFDNMFCSIDNLQVLCTCCHYFKTQIEKELDDV